MIELLGLPIETIRVRLSIRPHDHQWLVGQHGIHSELTLEQMVKCIKWGCAQRLWAILQGSRHNGGQPADNWSHIDGNIGEHGVANYLGQEWQPRIGAGRGIPDVGVYDVRANLRGQDLAITQFDPDQRIVIGTMVRGAHVYLTGWYPVDQAKWHPEWIKSAPGRTPLWYVPRDKQGWMSLLPPDWSADLDMAQFDMASQHEDTLL